MDHDLLLANICDYKFIIKLEYCQLVVECHQLSVVTLSQNTHEFHVV